MFENGSQTQQLRFLPDLNAGDITFENCGRCRVDSTSDSCVVGSEFRSRTGDMMS